MYIEKPYYSVVLNNYLEEKKIVNPSYSLRAFARHLNIDAPTLSRIIKGERKVPKNKVDTVLNFLRLEAAERIKFLESLDSVSYKFDRVITGPEKALSWEVRAILGLIRIPGKVWNKQSVMNALEIGSKSFNEAAEFIKNEELAAVEDGVFRSTIENLTTTNDLPSDAIKMEIYKELDLARQAVKKVPLLERDMTSVTFSVSKSKIPAIKNQIKQFRRKIMSEAESEVGEAVYQMCIQLYPLADGK